MDPSRLPSIAHASVQLQTTFRKSEKFRNPACFNRLSARGPVRIAAPFGTRLRQRVEGLESPARYESDAHNGRRKFENILRRSESGGNADFPFADGIVLKN